MIGVETAGLTFGVHTASAEWAFLDEALGVTPATTAAPAAATPGVPATLGERGAKDGEMG